jgi:2-dehydro-3-deoxyphosphogluconate aldolase/(4S)-4-hydroxy-2-oxoglutarate aldolase
MQGESMSKLDRLRDVAVVAVIRAPDTESAVRGCAALVEGGVTGLEVTYSTPDAAGVIARLRKELGDSVLLGAGTVVTPEQAVEAAEAGAEFLVSPGCVPDVAGAMVGTGLTTLLGGLTPTEVMTAVRLGADAVKVFPASLGGVGFLKALKDPFPDVDFVPTGGVNATNLGSWLDAGAVAVGAGGALCSTADLRGGDWDGLTARARTFTEALTAWREGRA